MWARTLGKQFLIPYDICSHPHKIILYLSHDTNIKQPSKTLNWV